MDAQYTIKHNGRTYTAKDQAELTNRVFPGWFGDAAEGDEYTAEWAVSATDDAGRSVRIVWRWTDVRGQELEDAGNYDWDTTIAEIRDEA